MATKRTNPAEFVTCDVCDVRRWSDEPCECMDEYGKRTY